MQSLLAGLRAAAESTRLRLLGLCARAELTVGNLYQDQKVFEVVVVGSPDIRHDLGSVQNALIDTATGGHVRLGDVASITIGPGYSEIKHIAPHYEIFELFKHAHNNWF